MTASRTRGPPPTPRNAAPSDPYRDDRRGAILGQRRVVEDKRTWGLPQVSSFIVDRQAFGTARGIAIPSSTSCSSAAADPAVRGRRAFSATRSRRSSTRAISACVASRRTATTNSWRYPSDRVGRVTKPRTRSLRNMRKSLRVLICESNTLSEILLNRLLLLRGHIPVRSTRDDVATQIADLSYERVLIDIQLLPSSWTRTDGVIALTSMSSREAEERCRARGIERWLTKPVLASDLWATIEDEQQ